MLEITISKVEKALITMDPKTETGESINPVPGDPVITILSGDITGQPAGSKQLYIAAGEQLGDFEAKVEANFDPNGDGILSVGSENIIVHVVDTRVTDLGLAVSTIVLK